MKKESGVTLVALVVTIIVMLILVSVGVVYTLNSGKGIIDKTINSAADYERKDIYENFASYIIYTKRRRIDVAKTYQNIKDNLNKEISLISPSLEEQIDDEVIFAVKGKKGNYAYKILGDEIISIDQKPEEIVVAETPTTKIWSVNAEKKAIIKYLGDGGEVVVPKKVWDDDSNKWIEIEKLGTDNYDAPFYKEYSNNIKLTIPDGIKIMPHSLIGPKIYSLTLYDVIYDNNHDYWINGTNWDINLEEVIIKKNCGAKIEGNYWKIFGVNSLKKIVIEDGATIPKKMFWNCQNLEEIKIGDSVCVKNDAFCEIARFRTNYTWK